MNTDYRHSILALKVQLPSFLERLQGGMIKNVFFKEEINSLEERIKIVFGNETWTNLHINWDENSATALPISELIEKVNQLFSQIFIANESIAKEEEPTSTDLWEDYDRIKFENDFYRSHINTIAILKCAINDIYKGDYGSELLEKWKDSDLEITSREGLIELLLNQLQKMNLTLKDVEIYSPDFVPSNYSIKSLIGHATLSQKEAGVLLKCILEP